MNQLLDVNALASLRSTSFFGVRAYVRQGKLIPVPVGRRVLFEISEAERFISDAKSRSQADTPIMATSSVS